MAATAALADLGDTGEILLDGGPIEKGGVGRVEGQA